MAAVDFNKPIIVTVSFDDSDEENSDSTNIIKKDKMKEEFEDTCEIGHIKQIKNEIKILNAQISKTTDEEDKINNVIKVKNDNDVLSSSSSIQSKICKSNSENTRPSNQTSVQTEQNIYGGSDIKENSKEVKLVSNNTQSGGVLVCVKNLLKSVATYLTLILQAQKSYTEKLFNSSESEYNIILRRRFEHIKYQYFNLSYSTVENLIIPKKQDPIYLRKFLEGAVELAKYRNLFITYEEILPIFTELVEWTENKMKSHQLDLSISFETASVPQSHNGNDMLQKQQNMNTLLPKQILDNPRALPNMTNLNVYSENSHIRNEITTPQSAHIVSLPNYSNSYFPTAITNMGSTHPSHANKLCPVNNFPSQQTWVYLNKTNAPRSSNPSESSQYNSTDANGFPPRYVTPNPNCVPNSNNLSHQTPQNNSNHANWNAQSSNFQFQYPNRNLFTNTYAGSNNLPCENLYNNIIGNENKNANSNCFQSEYSNGLQTVNVTSTETAQNILTSANKNANINMLPKITAAPNNLPTDTLQNNSFNPSGTPKRKWTKKSTKSCIYSAGPPWRQVKINVDSEILSQQNKQLNSNNTKALASNDTLRSRGTNQNYHAHGNQTDISGSGIQSQVNGGSTFSKQIFENLQNKLPPNPVVPSKHSVPPPPSYNIARNWQNPTPISSQPPPPSYNIARNWQNPTPISSQPYTQPVDNSAPVAQIEANHQRSPPEIVRSVSTDSGFMSPVHFNNGGGPTTPNTSVEEFETSDNLNLLITHVTSLNPNAAYLEDGLCHVCKKTTKNKCLGCFNNYYCSVACQQSDWKFHMSSCGTK